MSVAVCFAAMTPARRAVCSGSPFFTAPLRMRRSASALMVISPRARASRAVTALPPTSSNRAFPRESTCDSLVATAVSLRKVEREALERDGQIHALELDVFRHLQRTRREIEDRLDAGGDHLLDDRLSMMSRHGNDGDVETLLLCHP